MSEDAPCGFKIPYLEAIQVIPGDNASEKFSWIGKLASKSQPNAIESLEQLYSELLPLLRVEVAVKHKRYKDITLALMSDDSTIVGRALKASWFFDGRHKIVDVAYFCNSVFPFVSLRTINRIVKTLARRMKNPIFAREMFTAVASTYNVETALPLIVACDDTFIFYTLEKMNCLLSVKILKKLFYKNCSRIGQLVFEFFFNYYETHVSKFGELFEKYKYLFPKAIKNNPSILIRMNNLNLDHQPQLRMLSNTCAKRFLREALQHVIVNPKAYINIISNKIFNAALKKKFPDLMNNSLLHEFYKNEIFSILAQRPEETNIEQDLKTYRDVCSGELVDLESVTPLVLRLLPVKKRTKLARRKINANHSYEVTSCSTAWICYFPAKKATSVLKLRLNRASDSHDKFNYILQMIYACEVNNDEDELYNTLKYIINNGHVVSDSVEIYKERIQTIIFFSKVPYLSEKNGFLMYNIIQMFYEKYGYVQQDVLYTMIINRLIHEKPIEDLIEMLLKTNNNYWPIYIVNLIPAFYLQYYQQFVVTFINIIQQKYAISWGEKLQQEIAKKQTRRQQEEKSRRRKDHSQKEQGELREEKRNRHKALIEAEKSENGEKYILCWLVVGMYNLNYHGKKSGLERMSIKNYPWFTNAIYTIMRFGTNFPSRRLARILLHKYEPELIRSWFLPNTSKNIADVISDAALRLLKKNFQSVLDNWEEYLMECKKHYRHKHVQRFVRATRWYKDIPVKFAERCISDLYGEDTKETSSALIILCLLLDDKSLTKLVNPFIFVRLEMGMKKHKFMRVLHFIKKFSNLLKSL